MPFVFTDRKILLNPCRDGDLWGFTETATIPLWNGRVPGWTTGELSVQVNVSARHGHLKAEDQQIIVEKVDRVRRLFDRINAIEVTVDLGRLDRPSVEINVSAEHAPDFVAFAEAPTVLSALDSAIGKVEQQVRKHKERVTDHKGPGHRHIEGETTE